MYLFLCVFLANEYTYKYTSFLFFFYIYNLKKYGHEYVAINVVENFFFPKKVSP